MSNLKLISRKNFNINRMEEEEHLKFIVSRSHAGNVKQQVGLGPFIGNLQEPPGPSCIFQRTEREFKLKSLNIRAQDGRSFACDHGVRSKIKRKYCRIGRTCHL
jgi:hypothetical protein